MSTVTNRSVAACLLCRPPRLNIPAKDDRFGIKSEAASSHGTTKQRFSQLWAQFLTSLNGVGMMQQATVSTQGISTAGETTDGVS